MKTLTAMLLATFLGLGASLAQADDPVAKPKSTRPQPAATAAAPAAPVTPVAISQQDRMKLCSKQATGKKGAERKDFMKTCLSKKTKA